MGRGWLNSDYEPVRLAASAAIVRQNHRAMLEDLVETLDDPYLLNRQFGQRQLEQMTGIDTEALGYRFYMTPGERAAPLSAIREAVQAAGAAPNAGALPPLETRDRDAR